AFSFSSFPNLLAFDVCNNSIYGHIPPTIGNLSKLEFLGFSPNDQRRNIPWEIGLLDTLNQLWIGPSNLIGPIPSCIGNLRNLTILSIWGNPFSGSFPLERSFLKSLQHLSFSHNNMTGTIPHSIGNLTKLNIMEALYVHLKLDYIDMSHNRFAWEQPRELGEWQNITALKISNHFVSREIPSTLASASNDGKMIYENIIDTTEEFKPNYCFGSGNYGSVYKGTVPIGQVVAVKKFHSSDVEETNLKAFKSEITMLLDIRHRNTVKLYGFYSNPKHINVLLDLEHEAHVSDFGTARHPGSLISLLSSPSFPTSSLSSLVDQDMLLKDVVDQRIPFPNIGTAINGVIHFTKLAIACLEAKPQSHPTMHQLSKEFIRQSPAFLKDISSNNIALMDSKYEAHVYDFGTASLSGATSVNPVRVGVREEANALLKWKASLDSQSQVVLNSWSGSNPCNSWAGISCDSSHQSVTNLTLTNFGLRGTLQAFNFSSFPNLRGLVLWNNSFYGPIPPSIGNLSKLLVLDLDMNDISGNIPGEIGLLESLKELWIGPNNLTGLIPSSIGNLRNLTLLSIWGNPLSGFFPPEIGFLKSIELLGIAHNNMTGSIPYSIGNLTKLSDLRITKTFFTGSLPQELNNLTSLRHLHLSGNMFTGTLPPNVCLGGLLENFTAASNHFSGPIPTSMRNCTTLHRLRLDWNQLTGNISKALGVYPRLDYIDLSHNRLQGQLPREMGEWHNMTALKISNNFVSGEIPSALASASKLRLIDLSWNRLIGEIPKELRKLESLFSLNLNNNQLSSTIPVEIGMLTSLQVLDLAANNLSGHIPAELRKCTNLLEMNLSDNKLTHGIPSIVGSLTSLEVLDLSSNELMQEIPPKLGNLQTLSTLNLSHNKLSGLIPDTFDRLLGLTAIDISNNELEGPIPDIEPFLNASFEAYQNNVGLCGNASGLEPCAIPKRGKDASRSGKRIVFLIFLPLLAGTLLLLTVIFYRRVISGRQTVSQEQGGQCQDIFSVWSSDGKMIYENIVDATEEFNSNYCIGSGNYGTVYKAILPTGQVVAVKKFHSSDEEEMNLKAFKSEITTLLDIRHRNIVKLYGFCSNPMHLFLVYEFLERGSLKNILANHEEAMALDWVKRLNIVKGMASALAYLHHDCTPLIIHRDISSSNVLLDLEHEAHALSDTLLQQAYSRKMDKKCDVYSFGVVTLEVMMGRHPGTLISLLSAPSFHSSSSSSLIDQHILLKDVLDRRIPFPNSGTVINDSTKGMHDLTKQIVATLREKRTMVFLLQKPFSSILLQSFMLLIIILISHCGATSLNPVRVGEEANALLKWKASLDNQSQVVLNSWSGSNPCNNWSGISCDSPHQSVTNLSISHFGLRGTLQAFNFSSFPNLRGLYIWNNSFYGPIPPSIGNLSKLLVLELDMNDLTGNIPGEIGLLESLKELWIGPNNLTGPIPSSIGNLRNLASVSIWGNPFSGSIPKEIGFLKRVQRLAFAHNNMTGSIPHSIGNLTKLTILRITNTLFSGSLPQEMNNLTTLRNLQLSGNMFTGSLPPNVCLGGLLENFTAASNHFSGPIPTSLRNCTTLRRLRLDSNQLTGNIFEALGVYPILDYIDLSNNKLRGKLPRVLGQCLNMTGLKISNNFVSGELPSGLANATSLRLIDLSWNHLKGKIPQEFRKLELLFSLNLKNNQLSNTIPIEIGMLSSLQVLDLAANNLSGPIPVQLGDFTNLLEMNLSYNELTHSIPSKIGSLTSLEVLDLSSNELMQDIPPQLGNLQTLSTLNLSHNKLSGLVPDTFGRLLGLTTMDISHNELEGPIPGIPPFLNASSEAYRNNMGLCGNASGLKPCSIPESNQNASRRVNRIVILIVLPLLAGSLLLFLVIVSTNIFYRRVTKGRHPVSQEQRGECQDIFSVWISDGKMIYENIIDATEEFNSNYCIGSGNYGS
ncbi:hypothetical protein Tsubulata_042435, partial [Turnera subulata]